MQHRRFRGILDSGASAALFDLLAAPPGQFRGRLIASTLRFARQMHCDAKHRLYLNIGHTGLDDPGFGAWVRATGVRPVYLVHDLIPITHPEYCRAGERERHERRMTTVLTTAAGVIGNSQATVDSLAEFGREKQLPLPPTISAWLGSTPLALEGSATAQPERPTFVIIGTIEGRKNHLLLLNVWTELVARLGDQAPRLLIIGQRGWEAEQVFDMLDRCEALRGHVVELNDCSDEELARHLKSSRALLFPSMAEGFGLPLVEALGAGVPVIASDLAVFREIGHGVPEFLSPVDGLGWQEAILDYARPGSERRRMQLDRMRQFRLPDWERHFQAVTEWLRTLS